MTVEVPDERNPKTPEQYAYRAQTQLNAVIRAWRDGDLPLCQDKLDEAYVSVVRARRATGPDHHHRETV